MKQTTPHRPLQGPALETALADAERLAGSLGQLHKSLCKDSMSMAECFAANHVLQLVVKCREIREELKGAW